MDLRDKTSIEELIPPPMIPGNYPTASDRCFVGDALQKAVHGSPKGNWTWSDDSKQGQQPKVGYVTREVGASISFMLDTVRTTNAASDRGDGDKTKAHLVSIGIAHLRRWVQPSRRSIST